jgi:polysaccharide pyruvyl transferase WcaK-like protein
MWRVLANERPSIVVGLLFHASNSDNFGIGAMTLSHLAILVEVGHAVGIVVEARIIGFQDQRPVYVSGAGVRIVPLRLRHYVAPRRGLYSAVRECDVVCDIGAGDSFTDIYGARRFAILVLAKLVVLLARRPLILSPQTLGPFNQWWTRRVAVALMNRCRAVVVRDDRSFDVARDLGVRAPIVRASDVAFRLPYHRPPPRTGGPVRIGINVSGLLFNGGYDRRNMFGLAVDYADLMRGLIRRFAGRDRCEVHLVSHVISDTFEVEDDYRVAERLAGEVPGVILAPRFADPSVAKSYIAGMDFFCGSRMHACIAAFSIGVPTVPIAYSRKFAGLFESLGYDLVADCRSESSDAIIDKVLSAFEDRETLRERVWSGMARAQERLAAYEAVLSECFAEIVATKP